MKTASIPVHEGFHGRIAYTTNLGFSMIFRCHVWLPEGLRNSLPKITVPTFLVPRHTVMATCHDLTTLVLSGFLLSPAAPAQEPRWRSNKRSHSKHHRENLLKGASSLVSAKNLKNNWIKVSTCYACPPRQNTPRKLLSKFVLLRLFTHPRLPIWRSATLGLKESRFQKIESFL